MSRAKAIHAPAFAATQKANEQARDPVALKWLTDNVTDIGL